MVGKQGRVFAFEPDPDVFDFLASNTRGLSNVALSNLAMSDHCGTSTLFLHPTSSMSNSLVNAWENAGSLNVQTSTFDAWAATTKPSTIRLVKIDVEGGELEVLQGGFNFIRRSRPIIILEHRGDLLKSGGEELLAFAQSLPDYCKKSLLRSEKNGKIHLEHWDSSTRKFELALVPNEKLTYFTF